MPWDGRGIEHAVDVIAWGIADQPVTSVLPARRSCSELTYEFELLVGVPPLHRPCARTG